MKNCEQNSVNSDNHNQSEQDYTGEIKNQEIKHLLKTKISFAEFAKSFANTNTALSASNARYSKEILPGYYDAHQISNLIDKRVDKMIKNHRIKKNWCKEDCTILAWILQKITNGKHLKSPEKVKQSHWETVAGLIPGVNPEECMFKWLSMKKTKLGNNKWSTGQSKILQKITQQIGTEDWKKISRLVFLQNKSEQKKYRSPKQCRQQWNCYLNPVVKKGSWSLQQDIKLLKEVKKSGRRWSFICKQSINGRTQNAIKNRYNFLIQHKKDKYPEESQQSLLKMCLSQLEQTRDPPSAKQRPLKYQAQEQKYEQTVQVKLEEDEAGQPKIIQQKITIVQCNYEQIKKFLKGNNVLIPAKIQNNQMISFNGDAEKSFSIKFH